MQDTSHPQVGHRGDKAVAAEALQKTNLEALLGGDHAVPGAALFGRHQRPDFLLIGQAEVRLQHPPVRVHA